MLVAHIYNPDTRSIAMPPLSAGKKEKIAEQILLFLFTHAPQSLFTATIAQELARDEEFIKEQLQELEKKKLVNCIVKNKAGTFYAVRKRWRLSDPAYMFYKQRQEKGVQLSTQNHTEGEQHTTP
jgi:hypothetical protein